MFGSIRDIELDRLRAWLDFWKVITISGVTAVVIAVVPAWINNQIQDREVRIKKNKSDAEIARENRTLERAYVQAFLERATTAKLEERVRFLEYVTAITRDERYREGWGKLLAVAKQERDAKVQEIAAAEASAKSKTGNELKAARAQIAQLKAELSIKNLPLPRPRVRLETLSGAAKKCPADTKAVIGTSGNRTFLPLTIAGDLFDVSRNIYVVECVDRKGSTKEITQVKADEPARTSIADTAALLKALKPAE